MQSEANRLEQVLLQAVDQGELMVPILSVAVNGPESHRSTLRIVYTMHSFGMPFWRKFTESAAPKERLSAAASLP